MSYWRCGDLLWDPTHRDLYWVYLKGGVTVWEANIGNSVRTVYREPYATLSPDVLKRIGPENKCLKLFNEVADE